MPSPQAQAHTPAAECPDECRRRRAVASQGLEFTSRDFDRRRSEPAHQMLLPKKPKRGCCATRMVGGPVWALATVLRFGWSFGSGFPGIGRLQLSRIGRRSNCAKASRTRTFAETSATRLRRRDIRLRHPGCRGSDRGKRGIEDNALRPLPIGVNSYHGKIRRGICPLCGRQFRQICIDNKQQRQ